MEMIERSDSIESMNLDVAPLLKDKIKTKLTKATLSTKMMPHESILAILLFVALGPMLIFLNNYILIEMNFPYPTFLSMMGLASTSIYAHVSRRSGKCTSSSTPLRDEKLTEYMKCIIIVGVCQGLTLWTGMQANLYLGVGLIQMLKSATIVCVVIFSILMSLVKHVRRDIAYSLFVIMIGLVLSAKGDPDFSFTGMIVMVFSILTESLRCVTVEIMMSRLYVDKLTLLSHVGPIGFLVVTAVFIFYESGDSFTQKGVATIMNRPFLFLLSGMLGFLVNFASIWVTQTNSSVTLQVVVSIRNIIVVAISVLFIGERVTFIKLLGFSIVLVGACMYREGKRVEATESKKNEDEDEHLV